ncbi:GIN domain-containing protein [Flagellimonas sp. CMM7]|uniref:GIN domain-containing protein n=1 Tax=Flagellimonas sp. CMM7 TaxID=2654676 RepID=UPI0013D35E6A|nr:DUF2807 domain-containing protein [Flagellimonas sp. CMM7]UII80085.1 DUF2807 domain-containing protein [Flagellimonas sp. CMM7]
MIDYIRYGILLSTFLFFSGKGVSQSISANVDPFEKVIISPHIKVRFVEGDHETVNIDDMSVDPEKIRIKVIGRTLRIYLDGAKFLTRKEKVYSKYKKNKIPRYSGTEVIATINYKRLKKISVRGEQTMICQSPLKQDRFRLWVYGESKVVLDSVDLGTLRASIYGEGDLTVKSGVIGRQRYIAFGKSSVNTVATDNRKSKVTAFGEGTFKFNVRKKLKVTAYGEALVEYDGSPNVNRGIIIGKAKIRKIKDSH